MLLGWGGFALAAVRSLRIERNEKCPKDSAPLTTRANALLDSCESYTNLLCTLVEEEVM